MSSAAEQFVEGMNAQYGQEALEWPYADQYSLSKPGAKYTRVVRQGWANPTDQAAGGPANGVQRFVEAFVENATGAVFKADGWKAPAKGAKYESVEDALAARAEFGGWYLYANASKKFYAAKAAA